MALKLVDDLYYYVILLLVSKDLEEEVGRVLTSHNKHWVADQVAYHYGKGEFVVKPKPSFGKAYPLWVFQGTAIRKDSDEAKAQIAAGYGMDDTYYYFPRWLM